MTVDIPDKVVNRLSLYHFILDDLDEGEQYISSSKISSFLNIDNSQVRKDLKYLDNSGKCHVGYNVNELKKAIEVKLGFKKTRDAFIVGDRLSQNTIVLRITGLILLQCLTMHRKKSENVLTEKKFFV